MSQRTDADAGDGEDSPLALLERWYHVPALLGILVVMLWTRVQSYGSFIVDGDVYFRGNDPWYHYRETTYLLENFPSSMAFDPWTGFPFGRHVGQFGTLWDYITAVFVFLATPITGGGEEGAMRVMLLMSAIVGTLVAIPTYFIARRFVDRFAAVAAVAVLALLPGTFFSYTLVGFNDHHAGEMLFQTVAVLGFLVAFAVAEREKPVWELVVDRDWPALKRPTAYAAAAGVALGLYMWTWQPGVLMVGFTGIFLAVKITSDVYHGTSPDPIAFAGAVSMTVAGLMQLVPLDEFSFGVTDYSLTQVVLPLGVALGAVFLAWLARQWEAREELELGTYPPTVGGLILASAAIVWLAIPSLWSTVTSNLLNTVGFSARDTTRTIGEAAPPLMRQEFADFVISQYGLAFLLALAAVLYVLLRPLIRSGEANHTLYAVAAFAVVGSIYALPSLYDAIGGLVGVSWQVVGLVLAAGFLVGATFLVEYDTEELYFVVWAAFIASMAFTQTRFNYYLAVIVAIGAAYFLQLTIDALDLDRSLDELREVEGWQVMIAATVAVVLIAPLVFMTGPVWAVGAATGPGEVVQWDESLQWMNEETPHPGELEGADEPMELYGTYERPADDDFDYPEGAYGVQSWWDYGHWITTRAERIPNANPFQQNAGEAANYLLAPDEEQAAEVLARQSDEGERTRYVMVDWEMVTPGEKFGAPVTFYDDAALEQDDVNWLLWEPVEGGAQPTTQINTQRYYESQMVRLYEYHGSAADPEPVVVSWDEQQFQDGTGGTVDLRTFPADPDQEPIMQFDSLEEAEAFAEDQGETAQLGGVGANPTERVEALENYRLVHATEPTAFQSQSYLQRLIQQQQVTGLGADELRRTEANWVKTFERVPGAAVNGSGAEPGEEVEATVEMSMPASNETFEYTQYAEADANGEFELHLPYSTTGYEEFGPDEGYTNTSVQATGPYELTTEPVTDDDLYTTQQVGELDVTEGQVVGVDDETLTVELDEEILDCPAGDPECPIDDENGEEDEAEGTNDDDSATIAGPDVSADGDVPAAASTVEA
ncbi:oligosaccharyl transferase, archaeosortase A system-associated [Halorubrum tibetense]|uniref:dolichyl-phosphooligosaccharide-protein glycotransferase n=1 Tax=Halorubrum tibetense TaxID=175631 RepID=A0ABD5S753_9EURY